MSKLPVKLQIGIRDHWAATTCAVQKALQNVQDVLGRTVTVDPEWSLLLGELDAFYPDKATLVPTVAGAVEAWCAALTTLADDEAHADWADELLERTDIRIRLFVEVSKTREMDMTYSAQPKGFIIYLPKSSAPSQSHMRSFFAGTLINCFETKPNSSSSALASKNADSAAAADDWADVSVDNKTGKAAIIDLPSRGPTTRHENRQHQQYRHQQEAPEYDTIPDISTLSRPDELLRRPPYHLVVHAVGRTRVEVQCSHSPTLQFLSDYLKKWSRTNHNHTTKPPHAEVQLQQSAFGLGVLYEGLAVFSEGRFGGVEVISPTTLLALVEGVLGYKPVSVDGTSWTYRRDVEFTNR